MIRGIEATLRDAGLATGKIGRGSGRALVLPVLSARANLRRFAEYLYEGATEWLPRKRAVFEDLGFLI
jgi:hypothetical protein